MHRDSNQTELPAQNYWLSLCANHQSSYELTVTIFESFSGILILYLREIIQYLDRYDVSPSNSGNKWGRWFYCYLTRANSLCVFTLDFI